MHREIVDLIIFDRLLIREAAVVLEVPEGTAKSRWMKAKQALQALAREFMTESERPAA